MNYTPLTADMIRLRLLEIGLYPCICCRARDRSDLEARLRFEIEVGVCRDADGCLKAMVGEVVAV